MKNTVRALALSLALLPALAAAQVPNTPTTLPANTVVGRLGVTPGPAQAIPFARFFSAIGGPCSTSTAGLVPATGGGTANFLRADCTFASPVPTIANDRIVANVSGSTAPATAATPTSIWDSFCSTTIGNIWVRLSSGWGCLALGYANPAWWGADPTGAADSASAFNLAIATGLPVRWPSGTFKINSQITTTLSTYTSCFCMSGAGIGMTSLNWPNATGGIQITGTTSGVSHNVVDIAGLKITTSQAGGGNAIKLLNGGSVNTPTSVIRDVVIQGDDYNQGSGSHYWSIDIYDHNWQNLVIDRVTGNGKWLNPLNSAVGIGVFIEGDVATSGYVQSIKLTNCSFGYHQYAVQLGSYWQGVLVNQCNFSGLTGFFVAGAQTGTLVQLVVANSIFYVANDAVELNTNVIQTQIFGNNIIVAGSAGQGGLSFGTSDRAMAIGNTIVGQGSASSNVGIISNGAGGVFIGNQLASVSTGIALQGSSSGATAALNQYQSISTKINNTGAGNSVGTAAAGNMAGVVP